MRDSLSLPGDPAARRSAGRTARHGVPVFVTALVAALVLAAQGGPLWAQDSDAAARLNSTSAPQAEVPWISGGIGDEAREAMRKSASAYNVHVVFSARSGAYLAAIPVTVTRRNGQKIHSGVSEGPLLYLKLPPGSYQLAAEIDGVWQSRRIEAGTSGRATKVMFVSRGE